MNVLVFTICAKNYIAYARTLLDSVKSAHQGVDCCLVLSDRIDGVFNPSLENWRILECEDIDISEIDSMSFRYDITEFSTAIKPGAFKYFLNSGEYDVVIYLDPDILVLSSFDEIFEKLNNGYEAAVTPHITKPIEDGEKPDDKSMLQAGVYNLGFLAVRNTRAVKDFMEWWHRRLVSDCRIDLSEGLFVDQKWADLLPSFIQKTFVCHHSGYNVAYWNLMQRVITRSGNKWYANGEKLRFFHFSGVESDDENVFSKHQTRFTAKNIGVLRELLVTYRATVERNGRSDTKNWGYAFDYDSKGRFVSQFLRRFYREKVEHNVPNDADAYDAVINYANQLAGDVEQEKEAPITNIMKAIWETRVDLKQVFDISTRSGRHGFVDWFIATAWREYKLGDDFLEPVRKCRTNSEITQTDVLGEKALIESASETTGFPIKMRLARATLRAAPHLKGVYEKFSVETRQKIKNYLLRISFVEYERSLGETRKASISNTVFSDELRSGATLVGYPKAELGMGEHVRLSSMACEAANLPYAIYNFNNNVVARQNDNRVDDKLTSKFGFKCNIFHINADQMLYAHSVIGEKAFENRLNIGYWAWELSKFPDEWLPAVNIVDEIWAPSRFIQQALSEKVKVPVVWMPLAVHIEEPEGNINRAYFGIPENKYTFLFYFDMASYSARKNPRAVLKAFKDAFPSGKEEVSLVVKVMGNDHHADELRELMSESKNDSRVIILSGVLSHEEIAGLVKACDCFVSMHRSEGFGRGLAEAMYFGKPVIGTNYSGNTDFMQQDRALLLDYKLISVADGEYPYGAGQVWADPSHDQAVDYMRMLVDNPAFGKKIGEKACEYIRTENSLVAIGNKYRRRLEVLGVI